MHSTENFNPHRQLFIELLTWAYRNTKNADSKAKNEERKIYVNAKNEIDYNEKIINLISNSITSKFKLDIEKTSQEENNELIIKEFSIFTVIIEDFKEKFGLRYYMYAKYEYDFTVQPGAFLQLMLENPTNKDAIEILSSYIKNITKMEAEIFNDKAIKSPKSLKEISSEKLINNSLVFANFTESVKKNEIHFSTAKKLLQESRNIPTSFKNLIESKRKESLEKESTTHEM